MTRILVVDDDEGVCRFLQRVLAREGMECDSVLDVEAAEDRLGRDSDPFDLVLLDAELGGRTGWDLLEGMRARQDETPVIFVSAHGTVPDRVRGLTLGADDYVQKPFTSEELVARVQAVLRRRNAVPVLRLGPLSLDVAQRVVHVGERRVDMSPREFEVLLVLAQAGGEVVSRATLLSRVWGLDEDPGTKVVEVQVARLRRKLGAEGQDLIRTVVGSGYCLRLPR